MNGSGERWTRSSKVKAAVVALSLLTLVSLLFPVRVPAAESGLASPLPTVTLRAASGATIAFQTQNGETVDGAPARSLTLPHLVLTRNGALTDPEERTLIVEVTGVQVPTGGVTVTLEVMTQHEDPDTGSGKRIAVWRESQWIGIAQGSTQASATAVFSRVFTETVTCGSAMIPTPTDYFRYDITVLDTDHPAANPLHVLAQDHAFLMESQWMVPLPEVHEESPGAAPDEMVVYTCDMFPFQRDAEDSSTRLPRADIPDYVSAELLPAMVEAFRVQTDVWGFPWYQAWTSYRSGEDAERLSVALTDGMTWFHGWAAPNGHSGISINVSTRENAAHYTLIERVMGTFHHELFHNIQRGINQHHGGNGDADGSDDAWHFFPEGTAVLASSVGQSTVEFTQSGGLRYYMANANAFLASDLDSYERMSPYHTVVYWRFLYEQCGGMRDGVEDPTAGMQVISATLAALYSSDVVDISASTDLVESVPRIMDHALANAPLCPFRTYRDSLTHFARAIYALRLDGGRCTEPGLPAGCGFYDPNNLYRDPPSRTLVYTVQQHRYAPYVVEPREYSASILSSYGTSFARVYLHPVADGQSLTLSFRGAPGSDATFSVQIWKLIDSGSGARPQRIPARIEAPEPVSSVDADGHLFYTIPTLDTSHYSQLALLITRVDAHESSNPFGQYTIQLHPNADSDGDGVPDNMECELGDPHCPDTDRDGYPDYLDPDNYDDGITPGDASSVPVIP